MANILKDIGRLVGKIAPVVGSVIANPLGTVSSLGISLVKGALGLEGADETQVRDRLENLTDQDIIALNELEQRYALEFARLEVADKDSARDLAKTQGMIHHAVITYLFIAGYFGLMIAVAFGVADPDAVGGAWRVLDAAFGVILTFWFGSSFGSKVKDGIAAAKARMNGGAQ